MIENSRALYLLEFVLARIPTRRDFAHFLRFSRHALTWIAYIKLSCLEYATFLLSTKNFL